MSSSLAPIEVILMVFGGILVFLGIPGNFCSAYILGTERSNRFSTRTLMVMLALADTMVLLTGALRYWLLGSFKINLRDINEVFCQVHPFISSFCSDFAVYSLCAIAVERFIVVAFPYKVNQVITLKNLNLAIVTLALCITIKNTPLFFFFSYVPKLTFKNSSSVEHHHHELSTDSYSNTTALVCKVKRHGPKIFVKIDFIFFALIPYCILFACNLYIFVVMRRQRRLIKNSRAQPIAPQPLSSNNRLQSSGRKPESVIKILTVLTLLHVVTTLPAVIFIFLKVYLNFRPSNTYHQIQDGLMLLMYSNNATNFLAYCASSTAFRNRLPALFPCQRDTNANVESKRMSTIRRSGQASFKELNTNEID